jgi:hypothetical protein
LPCSYTDSPLQVEPVARKRTDHLSVNYLLDLRKSLMR